MLFQIPKYLKFEAQMVKKTITFYNMNQVSDRYLKM